MKTVSKDFTGVDVQEIYESIEKTKKGAFFIDSNKEKDKVCPHNGVDPEVAKFFKDIANGKTDKDILKEDAKVARALAAGLV